MVPHWNEHYLDKRENKVHFGIYSTDKRENKVHFGIYSTVWKIMYTFTGVLNWRYDAIHSATECQRASIFFPAPL